MEGIRQLNHIVAGSNNIVFFGGAGVSTESGIPDFRSSTGIFSRRFRYPAERMLSRTFYDSNKAEFYDFYRTCMVFPDAEPCGAHYKLAEMEKRKKLKCLITQNIDGLHQKAGSENVLELHGSIHRNYCIKCRKAYDLNFMLNSTDVPLCSCGMPVKPDVVLYEEALDESVLNAAVRYIKSADVLIVGGTSLSVYPAAALIDYFNGKSLVLINKTTTERDKIADIVIHDSLSAVLEKVIL